MYLNVSTLSITWSHALNSDMAASRVEAAARQQRFRSSPLLHIAVMICPASIDSCGMKISHLSYCVLWIVTSFRMTMMSSMCRCKNSIWGLGQLVSLTGHPSTGQLIDGASQGMETRYSTWGAGRSDGAVAAPACPGYTCCISMWVASDAAARCAPHSVQINQRLCLSQCEYSFPAICLPYAGVECLHVIGPCWYTIVNHLHNVGPQPNPF